jgi:flagellar assembly protein FliH
MPTIIRTADPSHASRGVAFNLDDLAVQAGEYLAQVRAEAAAIVARAHSAAGAVRRQAEVEGREAALRNVEAIVAKQMATVLPALRQAIAEIGSARQSWLARWEAGAVRLCAAIAERVIRRELSRHPEITLDLVRESLELAAGSSHIRIHLNPEDHKALGAQVRSLVDEMAALGSAEVTADAQITPGGCRVETRFGSIDQQSESQLKRIEEELLE